MLLQRLSEYAARLNLPPPMYQEVPIRYTILLDQSGSFLRIVDRATQTHKSGPGELAPDCKRTMSIKAKLFSDNAEYTLGIPRSESDPVRVHAQHAAFVELVRACAAAIQEPTVRAIEQFLAVLDLTKLHLPDDFDPGARITFEIDGIRPIRLPAVRAYWAKHAAASDEASLMQCLVCGELRPPVERLPISIKGIPGGQQTGLALISANAPAFESYGLEASLIAPTCEACGQRFGNALNHLLSQDDTHLIISSAAYIFWTRESSPFSIATLISRATATDVRQFLKAPWYGKSETANLDVMPFYAAALSASGARVVVRDWVETTLGEAQQHLQRYFILQRLIDHTGERWFSLWQLVYATVRQGGKEEPAPQVAEALMHLAIMGGALPDWLLYQVIRRLRVEGAVRPPQASLIKMVLLSQQADIEGESNMAELDLANRDPAYLCGRLLAELEAVQRAALGDISATIVDRYYGTASSAPALVFGRLLRGAQPHLAKLQRDRSSTYWALDGRLRDILSGLQTFPQTLTLKDQGLFALGYYHERATSIRAALEAKERKATKENGERAPEIEEAREVPETLWT